MKPPAAPRPRRDGDGEPDRRGPQDAPRGERPAQTGASRTTSSRAVRPAKGATTQRPAQKPAQKPASKPSPKPSQSTGAKGETARGTTSPPSARASRDGRVQGSRPPAQQRPVPPPPAAPRGATSKKDSSPKKASTLKDGTAPTQRATSGAPSTGRVLVPTGRRAGSGPTRPSTGSQVQVQPVRPATTAPTGKVAVLSTGMAERLAEQKAMRRHRLVRRVAAWTGALAVLLGASWVLFASSLFAFDPDHLVVEGSGTTVDMAAVVAVVAQHEGTSLALLSTSTVHDEVMQVQNIRDVSVVRQWPTGLAVEVVAREPVASVPVEGGFALLDRDAVTVSTVGEAPPELPVIAIALTGEDDRTLDAALEVLASLPPELTAEVASISAATQDAVTLTLRDGVVVEWGASSDSALKVQVLATLRSNEVSAASQVFDVSAPTFPITR